MAVSSQSSIRSRASPTRKPNHSRLATRPERTALLKIFPLPNFFDRSISGGRFNYVLQSGVKTPQRVETLKVDYNLNARQQMAVTYSGLRDEQTGARSIPTGGANWDQMRRSFVTRGRVLTFRHVFIASPRTVNEFVFGYSQRPEEELIEAAELDRNRKEVAGYRLQGLYPAANPLGLIPNAGFGGVPNAASLSMDGRTPLSQTQRAINITNNISRKLREASCEGWRFLQPEPASGATPDNIHAGIGFGRNVQNPLETGWAYANASYGVFNTYNESTSRPDIGVYIKAFDWFLQDNWRVHKRFTLEAGLRFSLNTPQYERDGSAATFAFSRYNAAQAGRLIRPGFAGTTRVGIDPVTGTTYPLNVIGAFVPNVGNTANGMVTGKDANYPRGFTAGAGVQYGPRLGFAWDVFGNGRTAVRGGLGVFYNIGDFQLMRLLGGQPPLVYTPTLYFGRLSSLAQQTGYLFPQDVIGLDPQARLPRVFNASFGIQQKLPWGTVLDASYVPSLGRHLLWQREGNPIPFGANFLPQNANPHAPTTAAGALIPSPGARLQQHRDSRVGLFLQLPLPPGDGEPPLRQGPGVRVGLDLVESMDYNSGDFATVSPLVPVRVWNYGVSDFDRTHVVRINYVWDIRRRAATTGPFATG